jgi:CheY-like chemotaxis protein
VTSTCSEPAVAEVAPGNGLPIRVLLIEDDPDAAVYTSTQLRQGDDVFRVESVANLASAVGRLSKPDVDVILLDLGMPESSGSETHLAITSVVQGQIPVVIFTSDESVISQEMTKLQGASEYLIKQRASSVQLRRALREAVVSPVSWIEPSTETAR